MTSKTNKIVRNTFGTLKTFTFSPTRNCIQFRHHRYIHHFKPLQRFWESNPRSEWRDWEKFEKNAHEQNKKNLWGLKDGFKDLRSEVYKWQAEQREQIFGDDSHLHTTHGDRDAIWTFGKKDDFNKWTTLSDSDHNEGFSKCELEMSPTGKGLFQGFINTNPPKDGRVKYSGYSLMKSIPLIKSFKRKDYYDWDDYTHLVMRVRGDGRSYIINISTSGYFDITWNDVYNYVLFTRGGPYWQFVKIPFSKFIFASKGRVQDNQERIPLDRISSLAIVAGKVDGPFCLEVDYIGVECDASFHEEFAYETYRIPKFIANV